MSAVILSAETLNLPESFAVDLRGKKVELTKDGDKIIIAPVNMSVDEAIVSMRGILKGSSFSTETIMNEKRLEKERDYGKQVHS